MRLAVVASLLACTAFGPLAHAQTATNPARLHVIAFRAKPDGGGVGASSEMRVWVGPTDPDRVRVGFFESEVAGSGDVWRASGWTAAVTASMLLDFDPRTSRVAFDVEGVIDGPSAGAAMTVGVIAATLGHTVREDTAMTGTISPDGRVGPVGGIAQKIEAAAALGKKRVLIPDGTRFHFDRNLDRRIDLVAKGRDVGVEVIPVADVWTAYELFTDGRLPRPEAADPPLPSPEFAKRIRGQYESWQAMLATRRKEYDALEDDHTDYTADLIAESEDYAKLAESLRNEGRFGAAFSDLTAAVARMTSARESSRCAKQDREDGLEAMIARVKDDSWLDTETDATVALFRGFEPANVGQVGVYMDAIDALNAGLAFRTYAFLFLSDLPEDDEDRRWELSHTAADYQALSSLNLQLAREYLEIAGEQKGPAIPATAPVAYMTDYFLRAAAANMEMLEESVIEPLAGQLKVDKSAVIRRLVQIDEDFAALRITKFTILPQIEKVFGAGAAREYGRLGLAIDMFARSSLIVAKYDALDAELDENGAVVRVARERAFVDWLSMSDDQTRREINALVAKEVDPAVCVQLYDSAKVAASRDVHEKLYALGAYFRANTIARVLKRIASE